MVRLLMIVIGSLVLARDNGVDSKVLKPYCEEVWKDFSKHKHDKLKVFKHPSDLDIHKNVYCVPTSLLRFSQKTVSPTTSSGKPLQEWIDRFIKAGSYDKKNLPDVVQWDDATFTSLDNRRIYCAKKADLDFVPTRIRSTEPASPRPGEKRLPFDL